MEGISARLTGGVHMPAIYMHCTISSSGCSGMQSICALLIGGCISSSGCSGIQGIYDGLTRKV